MNSSCLKNKMQSNNGATLLIALVALIFCVMISAVIIHTAFSNVGRVKNTQSEEQNYLSVSSAVKLFKDSLEGYSISFEETKVVKTKETYDVNWETVENSTISEETTLGDAVYNDVAQANPMLRDVLTSWARAIIDPPASQTTLTITITGDSNLPQIAVVEAEMEFDPPDKKMTIMFGIKNASLPAVDKYSTVMTMDLSKATSHPLTSSSEKKEKDQETGKNVKTITVTQTVVHTISLDNCVITKKKS